MRCDWSIVGVCAACVSLLGNTAWSNDLAVMRRARESVSAADLRKHIETLGSDALEGREAGSRGGRAASIYLAQQFQRLKLQGSVTPKTYFQEFGREMRNLLGVIPGTDEKLKDEVILIAGHYDHVGYGNSDTSNGPLGHIHNGADDNASGTSAVLELAEAWSTPGLAPKRTLLFALWDGEEQGLLGSRHWISQPTVPLNRLKCVINMDMVGRLRDRKVEVTGTRSLAGLRRMAALHNTDNELILDFPWIVENNSDHWPFYEKRIPFLMPFTGFHDDYHRPSDDVDKINFEGMQLVTRWMFGVTHDLATADQLPGFRESAFAELPAHQAQLEAIPALPGNRLGVYLAKPDQQPGRLVSQIEANAPAHRAGLFAQDRIVEFQGQPLAPDANLLGLLLQAPADVVLKVQRVNQPEPVEIKATLRGKTVRVGLSWRDDTAEPGSLILRTVEPGSPADLAGLKPNDRVLQIDTETQLESNSFREKLLAVESEVELTTERLGQIRVVRLQLPPLVATTPLAAGK